MKFAALVAIGGVVLASACSPANTGSVNAENASALPPDQACLAMTYEPFESVNGVRGPRLDRIVTQIAVEKCAAATRANPDSARILAGHARALFAKADKLDGPAADALYEDAVALTRRAADAGDPFSAALLIANHNYEGRYNASSILAAAEPALASLQAQPAGDIRRDVAAMLLEGAIHTARYRTISDMGHYAMRDAWDAYVPAAEKKLEAQVADVGNRIGWVAFNELVWELEQRGDFCGWQGRACMIFNNGLERAKDPKAALAAAVDSLTQAYRSHDIAMSKLWSSSQDDVENAMVPGQSLGDGAQRYARLAAQWGGEAEKLAAADLEKAVGLFFDYRNRTTREARARVRSEENARWVAVAGFVIGALVLIGEAQSSNPAAADSWAAQQRQIDCSTARSMVFFDGMDGNEPDPYWSSVNDGC